MSPNLLCRIPAEKVVLYDALLKLGTTPVIDVTLSPRKPVPANAWIRARNKRSVPGKGPVMLAGGQHRNSVRGRDSWIEVNRPQPIPKSCKGIILISSTSPGWSSSWTTTDLIEHYQTTHPDLPIYVDWSGMPSSLSRLTWRDKVDGIIISDVLMGAKEFTLPTRIESFLKSVSEANIHRFADSDKSLIQTLGLAPLMSASAKKLLKGSPWYTLMENWLTAANPQKIPLPVSYDAARYFTRCRKEERTLSTIVSEISHYLGSKSPQRKAEIQKTSDHASVPIQTITLPEATSAAQHPTAQNLVPSQENGHRSSETEAVLTPISETSASDLYFNHNTIAVVGLGCRLPSANSVQEFESLLRDRISAIREVPNNRWEWPLFWSEERSTPDKTYSKIGGFLERFTFNPKRFRIPPKVAKRIDVVQQITLESTYEALVDAGVVSSSMQWISSIDRSKVGVVLGNSMGGESRDDFALRTRFPEIIDSLKQSSEFAALPENSQHALITQLKEISLGRLPDINEDTMPGELSNVIAGRVCAAFDLHGPNFTVDAACASSMAALQAAVSALEDGSIDLAVTGGADRSMGVPTFVKFSKIGALSGDQSAPFDTSANGFVMGEGCGILILRRLSDAIADGQKIYALVRGIGSSSDGKGKGITAPNPRGQRLAINRAYESAQISPEQVSYVECHGTSTQVGDRVEAEVLNETIAKQRSTPLRIGSVKSNIGHLKSAAGAASLIKAVLSISNGIFYPTLNYQQQRSDIDMRKLRVQTHPEAWEQPSYQRHTGVSAFGFGGTNFHVVLSGAPSAEEIQIKSDRAFSQVTLPPATSHMPEKIWWCSGPSLESLVADLPNHCRFDPSHRFRAAGVANTSSRRSHHQQAKSALLEGKKPELLRNRGIYIEDCESESSKGKLAIVFTGQGSQAVDMMVSLAAEFPVVKDTFEEADSVLKDELGASLWNFIRSNPEHTERERQAQLSLLTDTRIAQPVTLTIDIALYRALSACGIKADMVAGHSLGEYAAAVAAGVMSFKDALRAVSVRSREMASIKLNDTGQMASISADPETVQKVLEQIDGYVVIANKNHPRQTVIAGETKSVDEAILRFKAQKFQTTLLQVSHAFHTDIVAPAAKPLHRILSDIELSVPSIPFSSNVTAGWMPQDRESVIEVLTKQVTHPVRWTEQIEFLYQNGARVFLECGPSATLCGLISRILRGREHRVIYTNRRNHDEQFALNCAIASLWTLGKCDHLTPGLSVPSNQPPQLCGSRTLRARK